LSSRILSLLLAADQRKYERAFLAMMDDTEGQGLLVHHAADALLWWPVHEEPLSFDVKGLLLACMGVQSATRATDGNSGSDLRGLLAAQLLGIEKAAPVHLSRSDAATSPDAWYYLSRTAIAGIVTAQPWSRVSVARHACRLLIDCEFTVAARALTLLRRLGTPSVRPVVHAQLDRFERQATDYIIGLAATRPISWLSWEAQLMAGRKEAERG
jgi:hypothetical protein